MLNRDKTALITGASSGIGRALARQFAAHGHDVILVARDAARLEALAAELRQEFQVAATPLASDLGAPVGVEALLKALGDRRLDVDILVSNAGFGLHGAFLSVPLDQELAMVDLQIGTLLRLTKALAPGMVKRGHGRILNVASIYSFSPVAFQSVYGACKAFMHSFSTALRSELDGTGVSVTVVYPGATKTEFRQRAGVREKPAGGPGMSAEAVAAAAYVGTMAGKRAVVPGLVNKTWVGVTGVMPAATVAGILRVINRVRLGESGKA